MPTETFEGQRTLRVGSATIELRKGRWHSPEGDLFIYLPDKKVLIAIDTLAAGHVPFMDFDLSTNMHAYLGVAPRSFTRVGTTEGAMTSEMGQP